VNSNRLTRPVITTGAQTVVVKKIRAKELQKRTATIDIPSESGFDRRLQMRQRIDSHIHSLGSRRFTPRMFIPVFNLRGFSMSQLSLRARIYDAGIATRIVVAPRSDIPAYPPNVTIRAISIDSDRLGFGIEHARIGGMPLA